MHMWVLAFLIFEADNPLYMDLSFLIMASNTLLVVSNNTLIDIFNSCTYFCDQYSGFFMLGQDLLGMK